MRVILPTFAVDSDAPRLLQSAIDGPPHFGVVAVAAHASVKTVLAVVRHAPSRLSLEYLAQLQLRCRQLAVGPANIEIFLDREFVLGERDPTAHSIGVD